MFKDKKVIIKKLSQVENPHYETAQNKEWKAGVDNYALSPPVDWAVEGILLNELEVGQPALMLREKRNGIEITGIWQSSYVTQIDENKFHTLNSIYLIEEVKDIQ